MVLSYPFRLVKRIQSLLFLLKMLIPVLIFLSLWLILQMSNKDLLLEVLALLYLTKVVIPIFMLVQWQIV